MEGRPQHPPDQRGGDPVRVRRAGAGRPPGGRQHSLSGRFLCGPIGSNMVQSDHVVFNWSGQEFFPINFWVKFNLVPGHIRQDQIRTRNNLVFPKFLFVVLRKLNL